MRTSREGLDLIKSFEGFVGHPYRDAVGVWTIGYGHTGADVRRMGTLTKAKGTELLRRDIQRYEAAVRNLVKKPLSQRQFDALVSFTYNVGPGALQGSTLRRSLNAGHYAKAANEFLKWNRGGGRVLAGLTRRRRAERKLFLRGSTWRTRVRAAASR